MRRCTIYILLLAMASVANAGVVIIKFKEYSNRFLPQSWNRDFTVVPRTVRFELHNDLRTSGCKDLQWLGLTVRNGVMGLDRIFIASSADPSTTVRALKQLPEVEWAEISGTWRADGQDASRYEYKTHDDLQRSVNDPRFNLQWGMKNTGQEMKNGVGKPGADINIEAAWDITTGNSTTVLAVLDSGIPVAAALMPDYAGRLMKGYDFVNNDDEPVDDHDHGSNVTSIAAAAGDDGSTIAGIDWKCKILPVKILDENNLGDWSRIARGVTFALNSGAHVMNLSLGGYETQLLDDVMREAALHGVITTACMMNDDDDTPQFPAALSRRDGYAVIAVGATDNTDKRAKPFCIGNGGDGSNFGVHLDVVAPGNYILGHNRNRSMSYFCGTSQASPMVAGLISLIRGIKPYLSFDQIRHIVTSTAKDQIGDPAEDTPGYDKYYGYGRIDAYEALKLAQATEYEEQNRSRTDLAIGPGYKINEQCRRVTFYDVTGRLLRIEAYPPVGTMVDVGAEAILLVVRIEY